ncbi:hybrid sensor histidine kinase/response regulator [bacterium]|nr:hybrid sensor histidine kinase/response regulator [bacterium]
MKDKKNISKAHYCVLDDDQLFLKRAELKLTSNLKKNYCGSFVSTGIDAIDIAKKTPLTLFIVDIDLGTENGIDIFDKIKKITPQSRVIFITGDKKMMQDASLRKRALEEGGIDFITKPVEWTELTIKIRNNLELMSHQYWLEERVQERTNMLIHADRLATVGTMVSSIVHEVSTPLTFIKANQETCLYAWKKAEGKIENPEVIDMFEALIRPSLEDSLHGVLQIENLLASFRKFYKKEEKISQEDVVLVLKDVNTLTTYAIKKNNIIFTINNFLTDSFIVKCNKQELLQIITNILNNAIDALKDSSKTNRRLYLTLENDKLSRILIRISNNGPAIPKDKVEDIFEPFFTTKLEEAGTGLGLYIVRQILQKTGGDVHLENRTKEKPTVDFILTIPTVPQRR